MNPVTEASAEAAGAPAAADASSRLLEALSAERAACAALAARCAELVDALRAGRAEAVAAVVDAEREALAGWQEAARARVLAVRELATRLGAPPGEVAAALRRAGAASAAAEVAAAWDAVRAAGDEVRRGVVHNRALLQQARAFTAFALRTLCAANGGDPEPGYTWTGAVVGPRAAAVMDRRG